MNSHKIIYRLDFKPQFALFDKLGELASTFTSNELFYEIGLNHETKKVLGSIKTEDTKGHISVSIESIVIVIETLEQVQTKHLNDYTLFNSLIKLAANICETHHIENFQRSGIRVVSFSKIGDEISSVTYVKSKYRDKVVDQIDQTLGESKDFMLAFDGENDDGTKYGCKYGPYLKLQAAKHFEFLAQEFDNSEFDYDFIIDVDQYENNLYLHSKSLHKWVQTLTQRLSSLTNKLDEEFELIQKRESS